jgi:peptidoglycan/xylan/chitin deacetylase (PgdA/CDA1 family)
MAAQNPVDARSTSGSRYWWLIVDLEPRVGQISSGMALPHYYSSLGPFEEVFLSGQPILTYHHVGPRPRSAQLKGLYVSPKLFARQMQELKEAGFCTPPFDRVLAGGSNAQRQIFLTIDDGFRDVLEHALPALQANGFRAMLFLVSDLLGKSSEWQRREQDVPQPIMDEAEVRGWLAGGQEIGAHTCTHPWLTRLPRDQAREEIRTSKCRLEDRFQVAIDHFCYPFGDWNGNVRELIREAGYKSACTTQPGVNREIADVFALNRFTARYPTRKLSTLWQRFRGG